MATVSESEWPYIQPRGGPAGFLKVPDEKTLGFADFRGNRQYISLGNVTSDDRAALFLTDYPNRKRLKIPAHMSARDLAAEPELAERLSSPGYKGRPERAFILKLETFDWNCPQHITPRFPSARLAVGPAGRVCRGSFREIRPVRNPACESAWGPDADWHLNSLHQGSRRNLPKFSAKKT